MTCGLTPVRNNLKILASKQPECLGIPSLSGKIPGDVRVELGQGGVCEREGMDFSRVQCHRGHTLKQPFSLGGLIFIAGRSVVTEGDQKDSTLIWHYMQFIQ